MEQTLVVFKPDAVQRGILGEILTRFERVGLKPIAMKMVAPSEQHYFDHYETIGTVISRHGKHIYDANLKYMLEGPVLAVVFEGVDTVNVVRKLVGSTYPNEAMPGTIRGDFAHLSKAHANRNPDDTGAAANIVHASGNIEEAKKEIKLWFNKDEIQKFVSVHEAYTIHGTNKK
jgi:nucleoside-diphosphate kinase